jgi:hypothetical protein
LTDIASEFQDLANSASRAQYVQSDFFGEIARRRLATVAVNRGEIFSEVMANLGHEFHFADEENGRDDEDGGRGSSDEDGCETPSSDDEPFASGTSRKSTRLVTEDEDVVEYVTEAENIASPRSDNILEWLTGVHRKNRGFELGSFDCTLLIMTMQHQARKWKALAKGYISDMIAIVHTLVLDLLNYVVPDKNLLGNLMSVLSEHLEAKYLRAMEQTEFLLKIELEGTPATYNHEFTEVLNKW